MPNALAMTSEPLFPVERVDGAPTGSDPDDLGQRADGALAMRWSALNDAAHVVATLAGLAPEPDESAASEFPAHLADAAGWRKTFAERGIEDLTAVMEPGIAALLAAHARGVIPHSAALALWHEFVRTRSALIALVAVSGAELRCRA